MYNSDREFRRVTDEVYDMRFIFGKRVKFARFEDSGEEEKVGGGAKEATEDRKEEKDGKTGN